VKYFFNRPRHLLIQLVVIFALLPVLAFPQVSPLCLTIYSRLGLNNGVAQLTSEQRAKWEAIQDFFSNYLERRLSRLSPDIRRRVEEKLQAIEGIQGLGDNRASVAVNTGTFRAGNRDIHIRRRDLGRVFFNPHALEQNLYSLLTIAHELEHIIDAVTIRAPLLPSIFDSFRPTSFVGRTERRAFIANYDFYQEMRAAGISLKDFLDVLLALSPQYAQRQDEFLKLVLKLRETELGPAWLGFYKELIDLVRLDSFSQDEFVRARLGPYRERMANEIPGRISRIAGLGAVTAIGAYAGISQVEFERMWNAPANIPQSPPMNPNNYVTIPGRWNEAHYQSLGIFMPTDPEREEKCDKLQTITPSASAQVYGLEKFDRNQSNAFQFSAGREGVTAISMTVRDPAGRVVFSRTFSSSRVGGATTLAVPRDAASGNYRIRVCEFFSVEKIDSVDLTIPLY
jgi:hypothetical protein